MGSLDSRGVYIYDVDDNVAPMHTLLNLGQGSVSAAIDDAKQEAITAMTPVKSGWDTSFLTMTRGWKNVGSTARTRIRSKGDRVYIRMVIQRVGGTIKVPNSTGNNVNQTLTTLHTKWRPQFTHPLSSLETGRNAAFGVQANGKIRLNAVAGTLDIRKNYQFSIGGVYYLDW